MITRRGLLRGAASSLVVAPAIVPFASLMRPRVIVPGITWASHPVDLLRAFINGNELAIVDESSLNRARRMFDRPIHAANGDVISFQGRQYAVTRTGTFYGLEDLL